MQSKKPTNYPKNFVETVTLGDGRRVLLRPILSEDAARLQEGFERLSAESVYMRFLEAANALSDKQAADLATVDYYDHMALVGEVEEDGERKLVVSARYRVKPDSEPRAAEIAVVVRDDYQSNGLGSVAMDRLTRYARMHGIAYFYGTIHSSNQKVLGFVRKSGLRQERSMVEPGVWEYKFFLD